MAWQDNLLSLQALLKGSSFRHGIPFVPVSGIAHQFYCELKVDHEYTKGEIATQAKEEGTSLHGELLRMQKTTLDKVIERIQKNRLYVVSLLIGGKIGDIVVGGKPDALVFLSGKPAFVIELKTTAGDPSRLWKDQVLQAETYALLLELMGFDCSQLKVVLVRTVRGKGLGSEERKKFLQTLVVSLIRNQSKAQEASSNGTVRIFLLTYDRNRVIKDIGWAQDYWLNNRAPIPTTQAAKCRVCEFRTTCPSSLAGEG